MSYLLEQQTPTVADYCHLRVATGLSAKTAEAARMGQSGFERNHRRFNWDEVGSRLRSMAEQISPRLRARAISATSAKEESRVVLSSTPRTP